MNIKKGDIVQHRMYDDMQGEVIRVDFGRISQDDGTRRGYHMVAFHGGSGCLKYREPKYLRVIRRVK